MHSEKVFNPEIPRIVEIFIRLTTSKTFDCFDDEKHNNGIKSDAVLPPDY